MSYPVYITEAFVVACRDSGEANKRLVLLTRDFGLVHATAQGIRHLKSKLRFHVQHTSRASIALVRGKDTWRLTNAFQSDALLHALPTVRARQIFMRMNGLIYRLVQGEEPMPEIFVLLDDMVTALLEEKDTNAYDAIEYGAVLELLFLLGYIEQTVGKEHVRFGVAYQTHIMQTRKSILSEINRALSASQL